MRHGIVVGNIQRRETVWARKILLERGDGGGIASAPVDCMALPREEPGHGQPQPAGGSCEDNGFGTHDEIKIQHRVFAKPLDYLEKEDLPFPLLPFMVATPSIVLL
jgi:hypothetical protein